jgi:hypothetical protein
MRRVTGLQVRGDWQLVRIVYLPAAAIGLTPIHPCALCEFCWWWGHHLEEWISRKSLFEISDAGLRYEDGGKPIEFGWSDIEAVVLHRRSTIPFWRTDGRVKTGTPPFWLAITLREPAKDMHRTICIWPRQVVGGLFSLMRFAKELQRHLVERADRGEIPRLMPEKTQ